MRGMVVLINEQGEQLTMDENGQFVANRKSKLDHPYDYDPFPNFIADTELKAKSTIYTDRLFRWDSKKHDDLCLKYFGNQGQYWDRREPEAIQNFLREYLQDSSVVLVSVIEYCNPSSGYPYWRLNYWTKKIQSVNFDL